MSSDGRFSHLLQQVRGGDEGAAAVIFQRFVDQLAAKAHQHLSPAVRRQVDAEDVVQSVYRTFFRRVRQGEFQLDHWGSLWGLLTRITVRKCAHASRGKNRPLAAASANAGEGQDTAPELKWEALARDPSPAEEAALNDTLGVLLNPLREAHRQIIVLTLEGYTQEEVGRQVGCSERTVRRVLAQAQSDLEKLDPAET
jgi:RNA polymerase sigma-70 factor (ECF subfamily)